MLSKIFNIKLKSNYFIHHMSIVLIFSLLYYLSSIFIEDSIIKRGQRIISDDDTNDEPYKYRDVGLSFWDCLYFSLVTQTTVGYGDIVMTHYFTRIINFIQLLTIFGVFVIDI
jgi:hypothetical protein